ncbi:ferritin-like domain-containing protein [Rugosimonospora acidiphila]|uniref:Ferritin-like domain-containing protein n=1 Tax=Rugosimonospora acidiphila TaxID=556531 RepID=A0ABP9RMZ4_9ACTN
MTGLPDALTGEHAAIYGYGVLGAHLRGPALDAARQAQAAHRSRRDTLFVDLAAADEPAPEAAPAYDLPFSVTNQDTAVALATQIEERTGAVWRTTLPDVTGSQRRLALDALTDCALRAARWRRMAGKAPGTVALP